MKFMLCPNCGKTVERPKDRDGCLRKMNCAGPTWDTGVETRICKDTKHVDAVPVVYTGISRPEINMSQKGGVYDCFRGYNRGY